MSEVAFLGAAALRDAYAARTLSPVEVVDALLARAEALNPTLHAYIRIDADGARAAARAAEAELMAGRPRGPLHGIPVGIKDIIDVGGLPTTCHSKILLDNVATADAHIVSKLRGAGAIVMGKLSTHEFAIGGPLFDLPFPPGAQPLEPRPPSRRLLLRLRRRACRRGCSRWRWAPTRAAPSGIRPVPAASPG